MANGIRTGDPRGFNKGRSSKFREGSRVRQTPEEGRKTYQPERCGNNNKDEKMKVYLTSPSPFIFFFFNCRVHRPLISLSFFLSTSSNRFLFPGFSRGQSTNKIVTPFLAIYWQPFNLPIWPGPWMTTYSLHHRHVCQLWDLLADWLVWFFFFADSTVPLPRITWVSWPIGIQPSNWSLVDRSCLPVHTPILGKLDRQSVTTHPWPEFNSPDFSLFLLVCEGSKKRER